MLMLVVVILNHMRSSSDTDFENPTASALPRPQLSLELSCSPRSDSFSTSHPFWLPGKNPNAAARDKPPGAQTEAVQGWQVSAQPRCHPAAGSRWEGKQWELFPALRGAGCNLTTRTPPQVEIEEDDTNIKERQTGVTACVGKGHHSLKCDLLLDENRV